MDLEQEDLRMLRRCVKLFKQRMQVCEENFDKGCEPMEWEDGECQVWKWQVIPNGAFEFKYELQGRHRTTPKGIAERCILYNTFEGYVEVASVLLDTDNRKAGESVVCWLCDHSPSTKRRGLRINVITYKRFYII